MKAHGAKVKIKRTQNEKEVCEVFDVNEGGVEDFQPLEEIGNFRLPMLVLSPIIKVISFQQTPNTKRQTTSPLGD
ncbi:MAG: hypothetical protein NT127_02605 [Sphingobacteriales bacterium]|nr:hypothetical protein [Sphingobacteriales bacterium]